MPANALFDSRFLNSVRIQRIIEEAGSTLERERPLTFLDRLTMVNASDDELFGRFTAKPILADIIADGQKAVVYEAGKIELFTNQIANIKKGAGLDQAGINMLNRLMDHPRAIEEDQWFEYEVRIVENLIQDVRERMNEMACGMMIDDYDYNRLGVKLTDVSWGAPANLKVTVSPLWSTDAGVTANAANAKPIRDIMRLDQVDEDNYGLGPFDRITMSTPAFDIMVQSAEFQSKLTAFAGLNFALAPAAILTEDRTRMKELLGKILGKELVLDNKTGRTMAADGTISSATRILPSNKVILDRKSNGPRDWDMGNGVVTESIVAGLLGSPVLGSNPKMETGGAYGPLGYWTSQDVNLNPPGAVAWAVSRSFPRRHNPRASAVLTIW